MLKICKLFFGSPPKFSSKNQPPKKKRGYVAGLIAGGAVPEWALYVAWIFLVTWQISVDSMDWTRGFGI